MQTIYNNKNNVVDIESSIKELYTSSNANWKNILQAKLNITWKGIVYKTDSEYHLKLSKLRTKPF